MPHIVAVARCPVHAFHKSVEPSIRLIAGQGVDGDAHCGVTVKHRSRVRQDPTQPNLRQVHLIHAELLDELNAAGFDVAPGQLGENVTTRGLDLLGLPVGAKLRLGGDAVVEITGLRNPCTQLDQFRPGLQKAVLARDDEGRVIRKSGIMGIVLSGGVVAAGDPIQIELPPEPHRPLDRV